RPSQTPAPHRAPRRLPGARLRNHVRAGRRPGLERGHRPLVRAVPVRGWTGVRVRPDGYARRREHSVSATREAPHSLEAERSVLGAVLIKPTALELVSAQLSGDDFFLPAHREIFDAMQALARRREPIDHVVLVNELRVRGSLPRLEGGEAYILELAAAVPTAENADHYARIVREKADARGVLAAAADAMSQAYGGASAADLSAALERAGRRVRV